MGDPSLEHLKHFLFNFQQNKVNISGFKQQCGRVFGDRRELNFGGSIVKGCRSGMIDLIGQLRLFPPEDMNC